MQALIGNYAVPILEDKQVWGTSDETRTAYLDSQARRFPRLCLGYLEPSDMKIGGIWYPTHV